MALTNNQQQLIKAVAQNDLNMAKLAAKACLAEDSTQKNQYFVQRYRQILEGQPEFLEVPMNLQGKLIVEDVSKTFREGRYHLSRIGNMTFEEIEKMKKISGRLMELHIPYTNATMLHGEPGTGKTEFGRYVAYKLKLPFCYVNFSHLVDSLLGKTSSNLSLIFNYVKSMQCVFMLDEVDCIAMQRGSHSEGSSDGELSRTVITLMQEFDRLPNDIVVIAATNRFDKLDPAFTDRFSAVHELEVFPIAESLAMVQEFLADVGYSLPEEKVLGICRQEQVQRKIVKAVVREIGNEILKEIEKNEPETEKGK